MEPKKKTDRADQHLKFNFKSVFEKSGMTRYEFAEKAGMDYTTVGDLVHGNYKRFGVDTLEKICLALNCDVGDLFVWE